MINFDLPADVVASSIKALAKQSDVEILIRAELGREIRTQPVKGEFTLREALDRMLSRTGLVANQDEKTGVVTIMAAASANEQNGAAGPQSPAKKKALSQIEPPETMNPKNTNKLLTLFVSLLGLPAGPDALMGQAVAPNYGNSSYGPAADAIVELSPFVVSSDKDAGYQATSTLAGTRLNTPLKDLGASISVYTKDFLTDIGAVSSGDLLVYATNMEAAGPGGNFSGVAADINDQHVVGDSVRVNPQQSRTRGLAAPNFTRGFFNTSIAFDSYNIDRVTVNRGPNAALFGVGNPAGVVDTSLIRPDLQRNKNEIVMRYGNNDSLRGSVDFNRVLIDRKLAMRIAALHDKEEYNQRPAFEEKKRIYGALTFEPFKSTSLRANFESGRTRANRPITVLPYNSISDFWYAAGRPGYDWTYYDDPDRNPDAAAQNASSFRGPLIDFGQIFNQMIEVYDQPSAATSAYAFRSLTNSTTGNAANLVKQQLFHPLVNRDLGADALRFFSTVNIAEIAGDFWGGSGFWGTGPDPLPGQLAGQVPIGLKYQGFTDFSAFDFKNRMIDETSRQGNSFHTFNIAFEQRGWEDRVGIELAYDKQRVDGRAQNSFFQQSNTNHIRIDPNAVLPNGEPNPNFGRPYAAYDWGTWVNSFNERETTRVTGFLRYDFRDLSASWGKWLGRHTLTGLYEDYAVESLGYSYRLAVTDSPAATTLNAFVNSGTRRGAKLVYLGPSIIGNNNPLQLQPIQVPAPSAGLAAVPVRYFVRAGNATDPGHFEDVPFSYVEINTGGTASREVIKSQAAVLQSYWLQDHLITTLGWRRDEDYFAREGIAFTVNPDDPNDPGKVHYGFDDFSFPHKPPPSVAAEVRSYGAVLRWPRKLVKLPAGTDLSVFYNNSENFTPIGGRSNAYKEALDPPKGTTEEYGFNFSAFNDKLNLRVNWFETAIKDASYTAGGAYNWATNNAFFNNAAATWATEANGNPHLAEMVNAQIELLFSPLPVDYRALYNFKIVGEPPDITTSWSTFAGVDTTDYTAKGTEIELVFNPTRNWRIAANVARQETVQTNAMPFLKELVAKMMPVWNQLRDRPQTNYPLGWQIGDPLPAGTSTWGNWLDREVLARYATALATEGSTSPEQRKWRANLVTNYTFGRDSIFGGKLKGWGIGGAVRWQDKLGIGYPTSRNPDDLSANIDVAHPYYAPSETNVDAWVRYERKLWSDRIDWKVQLNVRNLYGETGVIAIGAQPWGEVSTARLAPERRWYLTNTFSF